MTQCEKIINHINKHGSITPRTADKLYGIMRLASRINDLRSKGYDIVTITKKGKTEMAKQRVMRNIDLQKRRNNALA